MQTLIHIFQNNRQEGPFTVEQVRSMLDRGTIAPITLAWRDGMNEWAPLNTFLDPVPPPTLQATSPPPHYPTTESGSNWSRSRYVTTGPRGVGGWLVFFCVGLTILGPIWSLATMATGWEQSQAAFSRFPSIKTAILWELFSSSAIVVYGFVVGLMIWSGNPNGRSLARRYLLIRLFGIMGVEIVAIVLMGDLPTEVMTAVVGGIVGVGLREIVYFLLWWCYFKKSKRVRNTYGNEAK